MNKLFTDFFTENDGTTFCPVRMFSLMGGLVFFACVVWAVYHNKMFDPVQYGTGLGLMLTAVSGAITLKSHFAEGQQQSPQAVNQQPPMMPVQVMPQGGPIGPPLVVQPVMPMPHPPFGPPIT
jgi:hypothetical protein